MVITSLEPVSPLNPPAKMSNNANSQVPTVELSGNDRRADGRRLDMRVVEEKFADAVAATK